MKKFLFLILSLILFTSCNQKNLNIEGSNQFKPQDLSDLNQDEQKDYSYPTIIEMNDYLNTAVKTFTLEYTLSLDSIKYSYNEDNQDHIMDLEHKSENGKSSHFVNGKEVYGKTLRISPNQAPLTKEILNNMDKIFEQSIKDFEKRYPNEKNLRFKYWSLSQSDNEKYIFRGLLRCDSDKVWDIYYNVETDIGLK
ncbi:MAG: hypothetical protein Q4E02_00365 [Lagierella massiliensis]|nr:hypothetical protein [Lagierella massiliensis]